MFNFIEENFVKKFNIGNYDAKPHIQGNHNFTVEC